MRRVGWIFLLFLAVLPGRGAAEAWQTLVGDEVREALEGNALDYTSGAHQDFRASGRTLYHAGRDSWGYWRVQGNQYCSQWPPSDLWACYDLQVSDDGTRLRFVGASGDVSDGDYTD